MSDEIFREKLSAYCTKTFGAAGELAGVQRLSGGASMESWAFSYGDEHYVLRRLPSGLSPDDDGLRGVPLATQADVIELARTAGVTAPKVRGRLNPKDGLGEGFIMTKAEGETLPHKILGNPAFAEAEAKLTEQCARELAAIHRIGMNPLLRSLEYFSPSELIRMQKDKYLEIGGQIPIYEYAFHWLEQNAPDASDQYLVHGDFRMGNLMIDHDGLSAVLDWELVRLGDPVQDLAYLCTPSWRFGHYEKEAGGFDSAESFLAAYAEASGAAVDPDRFRFWLVYSTLWWGVACMVMGQIWRSHGDRSLERTVIGRRVSEVEIDLALLFEEIRPDAMASPLDWSTPDQHGTRSRCCPASAGMTSSRQGSPAMPSASRGGRRNGVRFTATPSRSGWPLSVMIIDSFATDFQMERLRSAARGSGTTCGCPRWRDCPSTNPNMSA